MGGIQQPSPARGCLEPYFAAFFAFAHRAFCAAGPDVSRFRNASAFRFLAGLMSGKTSQRGQGALLQNAKGEESSCARTPDGCQLALSRQGLLR